MAKICLHPVGKRSMFQGPGRRPIGQKVDDPNSWQQQGLRSLFFFAKYICGFKDFSETLHREICDRIQANLLHGKNSAIIIPRDHFKSSIGEAACAWMFTRKAFEEKNYEFRILLDSSTLALSYKHMRFLKRLFMSNNDYRRCYGDFTGKVQRQVQRVHYGITANSPPAIQGWTANKTEIYVYQRMQGEDSKRDPNFMATAEKAQSIGSHFDMQWHDDLVDDLNYQTKYRRLAIIEHFHNLIQLLDPGGVLLYTATPWHDGDLTGMLRKADAERQKAGKPVFFDWFFRPCMVNKQGKGDDLSGEAIFPERWPVEKMFAEKRDRMPRFKWQAQWMLDPSLPEHAIPFKKEDMYVPRAQFPDRLRMKVMTIDPNFRNEDQAAGDYACIITGGYDNKANWWGIDVRMGQWSSDRFIAQIFDAYEQWRPNIIRMEKKFTSHLLAAIRHQEQLRPGNIRLPIIMIERDWRGKEQRWSCLHGIFASGCIKFANEIPQAVKDEMEEELERVGASAHDDFLDCLSDQLTETYLRVTKEEGQETFVSGQPLKEAHEPFMGQLPGYVRGDAMFPEDEESV
jgi:hypothetical protein